MCYHASWFTPLFQCTVMLLMSWPLAKPGKILWKEEIKCFSCISFKIQTIRVLNLADIQSFFTFPIFTKTEKTNKFNTCFKWNCYWNFTKILISLYFKRCLFYNFWFIFYLWTDYKYLFCIECVLNRYIVPKKILTFPTWQICNIFVKLSL